MTDRQLIADTWTPSRLEALRDELASRGLNGIVVPRWDAHQSEYVLPRDERLAWCTGFAGTWGVAVVLTDRAALFVDGRYTAQAGQEVDGEFFETRHLYNDPPEKWLGEHVRRGEAVGFDPMVLNHTTWDACRTQLDAVGATFVALPNDPIAVAWQDRPSDGPGPIYAYPRERAGESSASKRARLAAKLRESRFDLMIDSQPDNIAWLLNVRAADLAYLPAPQGHLIVDDEGGVEIFVDERRLRNTDIEFEGVVVRAPETFLQRVTERAGGCRVAVDPRFAPVGGFIAARDGGGDPVVAASLLTELKAIKNDAELAGMRGACRRDAVAWTRFLCWLSAAAPKRAAAGDPMTELEAEETMLAFRRETELFVEPSFRTISAAGANGALCHYAAPRTGSSSLTVDELYLVDSGGQFLDGTTDVTRTVCFAPPAADLRRAFTLVLKGLIALTNQRFPRGTRGYQLDVLARASLWSDNLDYDHGTGHGVGHFLSVHEHPQRLGKEPLPVEISPGMVLTIEPGHYVAGRYGIRIENMVEVLADDDGWMRFETLTHIPICLDLLDADLLDEHERTWLDRYHARTRRELEEADLGPTERVWLANATLPCAGVLLSRSPDPASAIEGAAS